MEYMENLNNEEDAGGVIYVLDDGETWCGAAYQFNATSEEMSRIEDGEKAHYMPNFWERAIDCDDLITKDEPSLSAAVNMAAMLEKDDLNQLMLILPDVWHHIYTSKEGEI